MTWLRENNYVSSLHSIVAAHEKEDLCRISLFYIFNLLGSLQKIMILYNTKNMIKLLFENNQIMYPLF